MTPFQQLYLGMGAKKKVYMDDVFSTYVYAGTGSATSINNGLNLSGEGGMAWMKKRTDTSNHQLVDTVRGATKYVRADTSTAEQTNTSGLTAFNNNGFTLGNSSQYNGSGSDYASWTFRKAPGFFDVVTYTGNGTAGRTVNHSLGSVPGFIMIKRLDGTDGWIVSHRNSWSKISQLTNAAFFTGGQFHYTTPTSTQFTLGDGNAENANGGSYVAYVFAGGESTAATARSVAFNGSSSILYTDTDDDYEFGTGDLTIEGWVNPDSLSSSGTYTIYDGLDGTTTSRVAIWIDTKKIRVYANNTARDATTVLTPGTWTHFAWTRDSSTSRLFVNGTLEKTWSDTVNYSKPSSKARFGSNGTGQWFDGKISNFRIVKGTAVYTSSFKPPTEPLTNITNTKLLFLNNSSTTGSTVTPQQIIELNADPSTDSPFDDPAAFTFGESGDQNIIKCGTYKGVGSGGIEVYTGFEPQFVMIKNTVTGSNDWLMCDMMRGAWDKDGNQDTNKLLRANLNSAEYGTGSAFPTSTGFKTYYSYGNINTSGDTYLYIAIRRSDGYVGKPAEAGTDVFAMDTGNGSTTIPTFDSGFPIDMLIFREPDANGWSWNTGTRLMGPYGVWTNLAAESGGNANMKFDSNVGTGPGTSDWLDSDQQAWMWKRHAGFDVVTWTNSTSNDYRYIKHSLGKKPEMIWLKDLDNTNTAFYQSWKVWHSGLTPINGVLNSRYIVLNTTAAQTNSGNMWGTSDADINAHAFAHYTGIAANNSQMVAMLFASVDGISKVGTYTGTGSDLTITLGFQPRFVLIKDADNTASWHTFDTTRGITSGNDKVLLLNENDAQTNTEDRLDLTSDGMTLHAMGSTNENNVKFIYYAHA